MATQRLSRLHQYILQWLAADHQRTQGMISSSHEALVKDLQGDKGNISRSLRTLETRGWIVLGRSPGGKAQYLTLTTEGHKRAAEIVKKVVIKRQPAKKQWVVDRQMVSLPPLCAGR
jgi:DNA-binding MarR family transcriptional regulator